MDGRAAKDTGGSGFQNVKKFPRSLREGLYSVAGCWQHFAQPCGYHHRPLEKVPEAGRKALCHQGAHC